MRPVAGSGTAEGSIALERLRRELHPALDALDRAAADPDLLEQHAHELPVLQYALHLAAERALAIPAPPGLEEAQDELGAALELAREGTAEVAEALDEAGAVAASPLVWEWRGALFAVRLALRRLAESGAVDEPTAHRPRATFLPVVLLGLGVLVVLGGALVELWPMWAVGLVLVGASTALSHRRP